MAVLCDTAGNVSSEVSALGLRESSSCRALSIRPSITSSELFRAYSGSLKFLWLKIADMGA